MIFTPVTDSMIKFYCFCGGAAYRHAAVPISRQSSIRHGATRADDALGGRWREAIRRQDDRTPGEPGDEVLEVSRLPRGLRATAAGPDCSSDRSVPLAEEGL
ncbi:hypothetical protein [Nocardia gipuzkoensis]